MSRCGANERPRAYLTFHLTFMCILMPAPLAPSVTPYRTPVSGTRLETGEGGRTRGAVERFRLASRVGILLGVGDSRSSKVRRLYNSIHVHFRFCLCLPCPNIYGTV